MVMDLEKRVTRLEQEFAELKGSFQWIAGQLADVQKFMHAHFEKVDERFDRVDKRFDGVEADVRELKADVREVKADVRGLRKDLPGIVSNAMRDALNK